MDAPKEYLVIIRNAKGDELFRAGIVPNVDGTFCTRDMFVPDLLVGHSLTIEDHSPHEILG